ncbi:MAG TPA: nucleotidyltransferase family protein [Xanthomonadales bacterium]|nr:nucleotidyltransferase family protein [Xanthomonadales bacterium]
MKSAESSSPYAGYAPLDAIVLAGTDTNPRRLLKGENKAFLEIGGQALVRRVVNALLEASTIGQVYVVGPSERLAEHFADLMPQVTIVEQAGKMLGNAWQAIYASEARYCELHGRDDPQRPLLFISSDLPLISAAAVDDFVRRCAAEDERQEANFSMLAGVAEEASLTPFYPDRGHAGIRRPFVHLADCRVRLANIYVGRPRTLLHQEFLQTGFDHRKAEKWKNVMALSWHFLGQAGGWQAAWITLRLQLTLMASRGKGGMYEKLRRGNRTERIERSCGTVLGGSVRMVVTPYGGLSLDVDNEEDFAVLSRRFDDWSAIGPR